MLRNRRLMKQANINGYTTYELKIGEFEPEYIGKMNHYLGLLDEQMRMPEENPSIGIILCADRDHVEVEMALRDFNKPIGVAEYQLQLPEKQLKDLISKEFEKSSPYSEV